MDRKITIVRFALTAIMFVPPLTVVAPATVPGTQNGGILQTSLATRATNGLVNTESALQPVFATASTKFRTRVGQDVATLRRNVPLLTAGMVLAARHAMLSMSSKVGSLNSGDSRQGLSHSGFGSISTANFSIGAETDRPIWSLSNTFPVKELTIPQPTRLGEHSLTRALGLKTNRIVIDAGHGGPDTGSTGTNGLMEKELSLELVHRLGDLLQKRLPGTEVVYTRDDDSFVPLERRAEIANQVGGDLFLSIHANSSDNRSASGVETYYLSLSDATDPMEVVARENAMSQGSMHELPDLLKKITDDEKIAESRDLATDIQESMEKHIGKHNRGVRKAPFIVLVGVNMPAVLAEVSFLSNPQDEQWLMKSENRERVAEGLYEGIKSYLQSTNSLALR